MTVQLRELQVTPLPDVVDAPDWDAASVSRGLASVVRAVAVRLLPWLVPVALLVVWQLASSLGWLSTRVLPAPLEVASAAWKLTLSGELWTHVQVSAGRALAGLAVGVVWGSCWAC